MDRLSTGSKESNMSTQSDWIGGEKKKKSGLIGKCFTYIELMPKLVTFSNFSCMFLNPKHFFFYFRQIKGPI